MTAALTTYALVYLAPVLLSAGHGILSFSKRNSKKWQRKNILFIHGMCALSIVLAQYALYTTGQGFPWAPHWWSLGLLVFAVGFSIWLLRSLGVLYPISSFTQEACMVSTAYLLLAGDAVLASATTDRNTVCSTAFLAGE